MFARRKQNPDNRGKASASPKTDGHLHPQVFADTGDIAVFYGSPPATACGKSQAGWHQLMYVFPDTKCILTRETGPGTRNENHALQETHFYAVAADTSYSLCCEKGTLLIIYVSRNGVYNDSLSGKPCEDLGSLSSLTHTKFRITQLPNVISDFFNDAREGIASCKGLILESARIILGHVPKAAKTISKVKQRSDCLNQNQFDIIDTHIRENLQMKFDIDKLALQISLAHDHVMRLFKRTTGTTVKEYYRKMRIHKAKDMMASGHYQIADVIKSLCFGSHRQLLRHCRKYWNATPKQLLKKRAIVG